MIVLWLSAWGRPENDVCCRHDRISEDHCCFTDIPDGFPLVVGNAKLRTLRMLAQEYVVEMQARMDR